MFVSVLVIKRTLPYRVDFFERLGKNCPYFTKSQNSAKRFNKQVGLAYLRFLEQQGIAGTLQAEFLLEDDAIPKGFGLGSTKTDLREKK